LKADNTFKGTARADVERTTKRRNEGKGRAEDQRNKGGGERPQYHGTTRKEKGPTWTIQQTQERGRHKNSWEPRIREERKGKRIAVKKKRPRRIVKKREQNREKGGGKPELVWEGRKTKGAKVPCSRKGNTGKQGSRHSKKSHGGTDN